MLSKRNMLKIKLNVLGLSVSQTQTGAYALVLAEDNGDRRIPIIIGPVEAQSIAIQLEGLHPPRPLTHDLFKNIAQAFQIELIEVLIYKLEEGIFFSELICEQNGVHIAIDSRTSDAIAMAVRANCPIYTFDFILESAGVILEDAEEKPVTATSPRKERSGTSFNQYSLEALNKMLEEVLAEEDYEKAAKIRDEINKRREANQ